jgi:hypothetical protein
MNITLLRFAIDSNYELNTQQKHECRADIDRLIQSVEIVEMLEELIANYETLEIFRGGGSEVFVGIVHSKSGPTLHAAVARALVEQREKK